MIQNKYKILLVEDEANIRNLVATVLDTADYQTIPTASCSEAKTLFASHMPDLIILDLGLPDMDGMNLLDFARRDSLTPIIVLSARTNESDKITALDRGANDYITKPFGSGELLARVRAALRNNRYSAEEGRLPGGKFILKDLEIDPTVLYFGLLSGATLGGNCTPIGASANIAGIGILRKEGYTVKNSDFFKIGIPFTMAAIIPAYVYLWLMYGM